LFSVAGLGALNLASIQTCKQQKNNMPLKEIKYRRRNTEKRKGIERVIFKAGKRYNLFGDFSQIIMLNSPDA
jgi:hypothetical protein